MNSLTSSIHIHTAKKVPLWQKCSRFYSC